jgi:hypothetical protein
MRRLAFPARNGQAEPPNTFGTFIGKHIIARKAKGLSRRDKRVNNWVLGLSDAQAEILFDTIKMAPHALPIPARISCLGPIIKVCWMASIINHAVNGARSAKRPAMANP